MGPGAAQATPGVIAAPRQDQGQGTPSPVPVPLRLERSAPPAQPSPDMACTTLAPHLEGAMLARALKSLNPHSAPGVDRVTWQAYKAKLDTTLVA